MKNFKFLTGALIYLSLVLFVPIANAQVACESLFRDEIIGVAQNVGFPTLTKIRDSKLEANIPLDPALVGFRREVLPRLKSDFERESFALEMESYLRARSATTKIKLRDNKSKYDVVIIGTGVHGVIAAATVAKNNPNLSVLLIERSDTAASNFRYARDMFRINSSNRASSEKRKPLPGEGNINELPNLPIQVSDLTAEKYPSANDLSIAVLSGLYGVMKTYSNFDIAMNTEVKSAIKSGRKVVGYELASRDGASTMTVMATKSIVTTGLGKPKAVFPIKVSAVTKAALKDSDNGSEFPKVVSFEDAFRILSQKTNPLKFFKGKKIGIVGSGDSANVFIEFLLGYAPKKAYGTADAQNGLAKRITWFGQTAATCAEFIETARSRYAQIGTGFRSSSPDRTPILRNGEKISRVDEDKNGELKVTTVDGDAKDVDILIVAAGYERNVRDIIGLKGRTDDEVFAANFGYIEAKTSVSKDRVRVGVALNDGSTVEQSSFVVTGPAAGKLPLDSELVGIVQNFVSIFNNAPRTVMTAETVAKNTKAKPSVVRERQFVESSNVKGAQAFGVRNLQSFRLIETNPTQYLAKTFAEILSQVRFASAGEIELSMAYDAKAKEVVVWSNSGKDISPILFLIVENRDLSNYVRQISLNSDSLDGLTVKAQIKDDGNSKNLFVDVSTITIAPVGKQVPKPTATGVLENSSVVTNLDFFEN